MKGLQWFIFIVFIVLVCFSSSHVYNEAQIIVPSKIETYSQTNLHDSAHKDYFDLLDKYFQLGLLLLCGFLGYVFVETKDKPIYKLSDFMSWLGVFISLAFIFMFFREYETLIQRMIQIKNDLGEGIASGQMLNFMGCPEVTRKFDMIRQTLYYCVFQVFLVMNIIYSRE